MSKNEIFIGTNKREDLVSMKSSRKLYARLQWAIQTAKKKLTNPLETYVQAFNILHAYFLNLKLEPLDGALTV